MLFWTTSSPPSGGEQAAFDHHTRVRSKTEPSVTCRSDPRIHCHILFLHGSTSSTVLYPAQGAETRGGAHGDAADEHMEARERATFYLDYYRDEIMDYNRPAGSDDDGPLTSDYNPDSAHRNVELTS
ncbi:hypothetical protein ZWY2020_050022 [Hordeum vulgare]|nr:hypothetical protein ZWY2020_050022 [Hordeum vulgare]